MSGAVVSGGLPDQEKFDAGWLTLREPADAAAREVSLLQPLRAHSEGPSADRHGRREPLRVLDLGSGTGSTLRWLAPRLPGPQRWTLLDHDAELLAYAVELSGSVRDAAGDPVAVATRTDDLSTLRAADLVDTSVVTASALLDLLAREQIEALASACAAAGCAAYFTLSVAGRVVLDPPHELDEAVAAAFDAHQRRTAGGRGLLGPDAVDAAVAAFSGLGFRTLTAPSPWRLGPAYGPLIEAWLEGWLRAAREQEPDLGAALDDYRDRRRRDIATGRLIVEVQHRDVLALPPDGLSTDSSGDAATS